MDNIAADGREAPHRGTLGLLREKGIRITPLRRRVLELLAKEGKPLSHAEIFDRLARTRPPDRVTLYRTLALFADTRLVHPIQGMDGALRFRMHDPYQPGCPGGHPHFFCRVCGRMSCLPGQPLPRVEVPEGTEVEGKQLLVFGVCAECRNKR
jgi:Fur family ferric uptake transcriptional regulator/Fur family zinc uptake transcriptional regulator